MRNDEISNFLQSKIDANDFPSAVYLVAKKGEIVFQDALGFAVVKPQKIAAMPETIYDLASLTKPLITGLLCAKLIERGEITLDDKITRFFAEFDRDDKREITVRDLLTHVSGFKAWQAFYLSSPKSKVQSPKSFVFETIVESQLQSEPQTVVRYSDFNFLMLGFLLEKIYQKTLDEIARTEIFDELKLTRTFYNPPQMLRNEIAANEFGREFEIELARQIANPNDATKIQNPKSQTPNPIWGKVHDGNAHFLGGVAGHAGIFSTAFETFRIARQFIGDESELLKSETCQLFTTDFTANLNEARSLAFELASNENSTASLALSTNSFGHLGFTGTSVWIDSDESRIFILLTNRTHHELPFVNINATRRDFHQIATEHLGGL